MNTVSLATVRRSTARVRSLRLRSARGPTVRGLPQSAGRSSGSGPSTGSSFGENPQRRPRGSALGRRGFATGGVARGAHRGVAVGGEARQQVVESFGGGERGSPAADGGRRVTRSRFESRPRARRNRAE